jgi:hypothetical protein
MGGIFHDASVASASLYLKNLKYLSYHNRTNWIIHASGRLKQEKDRESLTRTMIKCGISTEIAV